MTEGLSSVGLAKRSLTIRGHRTSVSLEDVFWQGLARIAAERAITTAALVAEIDARRASANLSSAIRVYVCERLCAPAGPSGEP